MQPTNHPDDHDTYLHILFETMPLGAVFQDADGVIFAANPAAQRILGLSLEQMQGRTSMDPRWRAIFPDGSDFPGQQHPAMVALRSGETVRDVIMGVYNLQQEAYTWINVTATPYSREVGRPPSMVIATFEDITARRQAEIALLDNEAKFSIAFHASPVGLSLVTLGGRYVDVNSAHCQLVGYSRAEIIGKTSQELGILDEAAYQAVHTAIIDSQGFLENVETTFRSKDGHQRDVLYSVRPLMIDGVQHYLSAALDITDRKLAEAALKEKDHFLSSVVNTSPAIVYVYDMETRSNVFSNDGITRLLGYSPAQVQEMGAELFARMVHPDDLAELIAFQAKVLAAADGQILENEHRVRRQDGTWRILHNYESAFLRNPDGSLKQKIGVAIDVTELKQTEQALRASEEKYSILFHKAAIPAVLVAIPENTIEDANLAFEQTFGYTRRELIGKTSVTIGLIDTAMRDRLLGNLLTGNLERGFETRMRAQNGSELIAWITASLVEFGGRRYAIATLQDLTERKRAEEEREALLADLQTSRAKLLAQSRKLIDVQEAERRVLALELHDELGQTINSIKLSLDLIPRLDAQAAAEQLQRAQALTANLVEHVRRLALELRPSMLDDLGLLPALNWLLKNYSVQTHESVSFQHEGLEQRFPPQVEAAVYRIAQEALTNIIRHANYAGVTVEVWVDARTLNLQIRDAGPGFDMQSLAGHASSGLGGMRERARLLGGELLVESEVGQGTTITAWLPFEPSDMLNLVETAL